MVTVRQICDLIHLQAVHRARRGRYDEAQAGMGSLFNEVIMRADYLSRDLRQEISKDGQQGGGGCRGNARCGFKIGFLAKFQLQHVRERLVSGDVHASRGFGVRVGVDGEKLITPSNPCSDTYFVPVLQDARTHMRITD